MQWSIFVMYGSAIALSAVLSSTGAAKAIVLFIMSTGIQDPLLFWQYHGTCHHYTGDE